MISRLQQADPSIKSGQPIPLSKVTSIFEKMRGQRDSGSDRSGDSRRAADEAMEPELLVPGFGMEDVPPAPLLGFGAAAEMMDVVVTDEDRREAEERMRRYDRNRDGYLTKEEVSRFSGNPMDFDRNRDGKLSVNELSVRYARRRDAEEEARRDDRRDRERESESIVEVPDVFNGRQSYRANAGRKLPEGLPGFFADKDANGDGQLTMAEFSDDWNDDVIASFFSSDFNRDGIITADEALRAVEDGAAPVMTASSATKTVSTTSDAPSTDSSSEPADASGGTKPSQKYIDSAKNIISRRDENGDNVLTASEWKKMLMSPAAADANRDGKVTVEEYAYWMQNRK